jgi:hypothetical protein
MDGLGMAAGPGALSAAPARLEQRGLVQALPVQDRRPPTS